MACAPCCARPAEPGPARSTRSDAAARPPRPACTLPRTGAISARAGGPALILTPAGPGASVQHFFQFGDLRCGQLALCAARAPGRQRCAVARGVIGSPASARLGIASLSRGRWPGPRLNPRLPAGSSPGGPAPQRPACPYRGISYLLAQRHPMLPDPTQ
jgi:hypothetical protein